MGLAEEMLKRCDALSLELAQKKAKIEAMRDVIEAAEVMKRYYDANPLAIKSDLQKLLFKTLEEV